MVAVTPQVRLTAREHEVLALVAKGWPDKPIAEALFISWRTVSVHVRNMMTKTDSPTRTALVRHAIEQGWLSIPRDPRRPTVPTENQTANGVPPTETEIAAATAMLEAMGGLPDEVEVMHIDALRAALAVLQPPEGPVTDDVEDEPSDDEPLGYSAGIAELGYEGDG